MWSTERNAEFLDKNIYVKNGSRSFSENMTKGRGSSRQRKLLVESFGDPRLLVNIYVLIRIERWRADKVFVSSQLD